MKRIKDIWQSWNRTNWCDWLRSWFLRESWGWQRRFWRARWSCKTQWCWLFWWRGTWSRGSCRRPRVSCCRCLRRKKHSPTQSLSTPTLSAQSTATTGRKPNSFSTTSSKKTSSPTLSSSMACSKNVLSFHLSQASRGLLTLRPSPPKPFFTGRPSLLQHCDQRASQVKPVSKGTLCFPNNENF